MKHQNYSHEPFFHYIVELYFGEFAIEVWVCRLGDVEEPLLSFRTDFIHFLAYFLRHREVVIVFQDIIFIFAELSISDIDSLTQFIIERLSRCCFFWSFITTFTAAASITLLSGSHYGASPPCYHWAHIASWLNFFGAGVSRSWLFTTTSALLRSWTSTTVTRSAITTHPLIKIISIKFNTILFNS